MQNEPLKKEKGVRTGTLKENRPSKEKRIRVYIITTILSVASILVCYFQLYGASRVYSALLLIFMYILIARQALQPRVNKNAPVVAEKERRLSKRTVVAAVIILVLIPLSIWVGIQYMNDRAYYMISLVIISFSMIPFFMVFEGRKPKAREIIIIAVLSAIAVAGRAAFFMLPQFKPVVALVIISGVCFGGEAGFLVGAMTGFVSNFFFGQGPWTPWQMFAFGIIGFLAGVLFQKGWLKTNKLPLCIYGFIATLCIYGPIVNLASVFMFAEGAPTWARYLAQLATGFPFDLVHAVSTVFFLTIFSQPMIEKLERIKKKYGMIHL